MSMANTLRFVIGPSKNNRAKINMKIVVVCLRRLAVDAFVRLIPIIQDDIPRYVEKKRLSEVKPNGEIPLSI